MIGALPAAAAGAGALLGGVGSYFSSEASTDALETQLKYLQSLSPQLQAQYSDQIATITSALNQRTASAGGDETLAAYQSMVSGYDPSDYTYTAEDFAYTSGVDDFQDPAAAYRLKAAQDSRQSTLAAQGNLFGGGAQRQLEAEAQELASTEWAASYDRMTADKQSAYQIYRDKVSDTKDSLTQQEEGYLTQLGLLGNQKDDIYSAQDTANENYLTALQQYQQNMLNLGVTSAGVQAQKSGISTTGNVLTGILGGINTGSNIYGAITK
jgi:hypothetical protein